VPCNTSKLIVKKRWGHALLSVKFVQNHHDIVELDCLKKEKNDLATFWFDTFTMSKS